MALEIREEDKLIEELEDDAEAPEDLTDNEIEQKYLNSQAQIFIQRNDFLVPNILQMVKDKEVLDLSPEYQRRARWSDRKKSSLIESLLMNVPIPPIFLYERDLARYEVMDGQQRLSSIRDFFNNEFTLRGLSKWPELNGRKYTGLPSKIQAALNRRGLAAVIVLTESSQDETSGIELRQYVFERLNTGGEKLNPQEVRNCIYSSNFNDMLVRIARSDAFTRIWNIPPKETGEPHKVSKRLESNSLYSKMADCEIVLRYFALSDPSNFKSSMKRTLDSFMESMKKASKTKCKSLEDNYLATLHIAESIYGEKLFRLTKNSKELTGRKSVPLSDAILIGLKNNPKKHQHLIENRESVIKMTKDMLNDPEKYEELVGRGNTKKAVQDRIELMTEAFFNL